MRIDDRTEWLEADGLGGFASGTTSDVRTRRYHALLLTAQTPPTGRVVLVNGLDAWIDTAAGSYALTSQRYAPGVLHPDGASRIVRFAPEPWPTWELEAPGGVRMLKEVLVQPATAVTLVVWTLLEAGAPLRLRARPFLSGRDYHATHHENSAFRFEPEVVDRRVTIRPYDGVPPVSFLTNGEYRHAPDWYRRFLYAAEHERGLDAVEDLASPGEFVWPLAQGGDRAVMMLQVGGGEAVSIHSREEVSASADRAIAAERQRRRALTTPLDRAADASLFRRGRGRTLVAGYPWFTDWGRDTFIAMRGLCLASGRLAEARDILVEWAGAVSDGMLPNRFPDGGDTPEFNAVDASLWYVVVAGELLRAAEAHGALLETAERRTLEGAMQRIVAGYAAGTRYGIRLDADGLLAAGVPGVQLTWMDARVGDRVITPRIGKPVEVQALWLNALDAVSRLDPRWRTMLERGRVQFVERFWSDATGRLADVVDVDHVPGTRDDTFRPNQIFAVGGLPLALLTGVRARRLVDAVEHRLLTPLGLRSLAPGEPGYAPRYDGDPSSRDAAYHQGTVWPWLMGPFVEAWVRVRAGTAAAKREARIRFVAPLQAHLGEAGVGHVSEIADADAPHTPRGCPFQAWSLGELLRLDRVVLAGRQRLIRPPARVGAETAGVRP